MASLHADVSAARPAALVRQAASASRSPPDRTKSAGSLPPASPSASQQANPAGSRRSSSYGPGAESFDKNASPSLVDGNNGNYQPSSIGYDQFPTPKLPFGDMTVTNGQWVRGWIVYAVPIGTPLVNVAYMPYGARSPVMWTP